MSTDYKNDNPKADYLHRTQGKNPRTIEFNLYDDDEEDKEKEDRQKEDRQKLEQYRILKRENTSILKGLHESYKSSKKTNSSVIPCMNMDINWDSVHEEKGCKNSEFSLYTTKKGEVLDRFGDTNGSYFSPVPIIDGNYVPYTYTSRSIPYIFALGSCMNYYSKLYTKYKPNNYHRYVVKKPFNVYNCTAASVIKFGTPGGAVQYFLTKGHHEFNNIQELIDKDYIEEIFFNDVLERFDNYPLFGSYNKGGNKHRKRKTHKKISKGTHKKSKRKTN